MRKLLPFGAFLILALMLIDALLTPKPSTDAQQIALPAVTLTSLDGRQSLTLNTLRGDVVVLNFFASWCAPCIAELPQLKALKAHYPRVKFYGVAWNDTPSVLQPWLKQHGNPFSTVWLDAEGKAAIAMGLRGIPETFVIGRDGRVRAHLSGELSADTARETITPLLSRLEAEHAPQP